MSMFRKAGLEESTQASAQEIQFAPGLLADLCDHVLAVDNVFRVANGPGFVLFGRVQARQLFVEAFREAEANPMFESRFPESLTKEEQLISLIVSPRNDSALRGMEAVGWSWWSPEGKLKLESSELIFLERFFKESTQVALKLKSVDESHIEAGLFLRDQAGISFSDEPNAVLPLHRGEGLPRQTGELTPALWPRDESSVAHHSSELAIETVVDVPQTVPGTRSQNDARGLRPPLFQAVAVCGVGLVAGLFVAMWQEHKVVHSTPISDAGVSANLSARGSNLVLTWDSKLGKINSAKVEILDGDLILHFDLTKGFEQHGMFEFPHETGNVQAVLTIVTSRGSVVRRAGYTDPAETLAHMRVIQAAEHEREIRQQAEEQAGRMDATNRRLAAMIAYLKVKGGRGRK